jgi:hypothetical protein
VGVADPDMLTHRYSGSASLGGRRARVAGRRQRALAEPAQPGQEGSDERPHGIGLAAHETRVRSRRSHQKAGGSNTEETTHQTHQDGVSNAVLRDGHGFSVAFQVASAV